MSRKRANSTEDPGPIEEIAQRCLAVRVRIVNRAVSAIYDEALRPSGLKVSQMNVLVAVGALGRARPFELERRLAIDKSTLSRAFERLRARGLLARHPTEDGRAHALSLTPAGRALVLELEPAWERAQAEAEALLGPTAALAIRMSARSIAERS